MNNKILIPLDGSKISEEAIRGLSNLCNLSKSEIHLVRVALAYTLPGIDPTAAQVLVVREAEEYLDQVLARLKKEGLDVSKAVLIHVRYGNPAQEILEHARVGKFDLIALSSHGKGRIGRWLLGSVAEKIIRNSPIPVLLVRTTEEERPDNRKIRELAASGFYAESRS